MKMSHKMEVLHFMQDRGSITNRDAVLELGCFRLSARILDLRTDGYSIATNMETGKNRNGDDVRYARYTLVS